MASITVNTNGQTLKVNASISHWTSAALAVTASGDDDIPSTDTTTITSNYTMHFANTATTVTVTVKQLDGTTLHTGTYEVNPGIGARTLNPVPDQFQAAADVNLFDNALRPAGSIAETFSRAVCPTANSTLLSTGRLTLAAIALPAGATVSTITFVSHTTALDTGTNQWFALYNSNRALLRQTADDTSTAWAANTHKTLTLTSPVTTTYGGLHYLGINVTATTVPTLAGLAQPVGMLTVAPIVCGSADSSLTATAPPTATTLTPLNRHPYAYVS